MGMSRESCPVSRGDFSTTPVSSKDGPLWTLDNFLVTCPLPVQKPLFKSIQNSFELFVSTTTVARTRAVVSFMAMARRPAADRAEGQDAGALHRVLPR